MSRQGRRGKACSELRGARCIDRKIAPRGVPREISGGSAFATIERSPSVARQQPEIVRREY